jgi:uncharacterized NAD(P)/FAD-binding protein YdhS
VHSLVEHAATSRKRERTSTSTEVAIVGMGPWGLAALERLISGALAETRPTRSLIIHVVEPSTPGPGIFGTDLPDYLLLNTPCGQHSMYPFPELTEGRLGMGFYEWAVTSGYQWVNDRCEITTEGRPIGPHDFLPRRLMGEYLAWFFRVLVAECPSWVRIEHHRTRATDITDGADIETVSLEDGRVLSVDQVIVTTGHGRPRPATAGTVLSAYPVSGLERVEPDSSVVVQGMGLVAIDVLTALTVGRGGRFVAAGDALAYEPSGLEPRIALFSRTGFPYCAKPLDGGDITAEYRPRICTPEAVRALRFAPNGDRRRIDARTELLPLLTAEMATCYYTEAARISDGTLASAEAGDALCRAWRDGRFADEVPRWAARYGEFDAVSRLFVGEGESYRDAAAYQARVAQVMSEDVSEALVPHGASPVKKAYETLRALRDTIRAVVEFGGLTRESHGDFHAHVRNRITRIVAGPPVRRVQELLALLDSGIVTMPFGPSPIAMIDGTSVVVRSRALRRTHTERFDHLILGHLDEPNAQMNGDPMLGRLARCGRIRPFQLDGEALGSIDLTEDFHPLGADGRVQPRLWVFGALSEGPRYFTAYIPSPQSRVRAFVDAGICADRIIGECR